MGSPGQRNKLRAFFIKDYKNWVKVLRGTNIYVYSSIALLFKTIFLRDSTTTVFVMNINNCRTSLVIVKINIKIPSWVIEHSLKWWWLQYKATFSWVKFELKGNTISVGMSLYILTRIEMKIEWAKEPINSICTRPLIFSLSLIIRTEAEVTATPPHLISIPAKEQVMTIRAQISLI